MANLITWFEQSVASPEGKKIQQRPVRKMFFN
jgi:hypothetical protein